MIFAACFGADALFLDCLDVIFAACFGAFWIVLTCCCCCCCCCCCWLCLTWTWFTSLGSAASEPRPQIYIQNVKLTHLMSFIIDLLTSLCHLTKLVKIKLRLLQYRLSHWMQVGSFECHVVLESDHRARSWTETMTTRCHWYWHLHKVCSVHQGVTWHRTTFEGCTLNSMSSAVVGDRMHRT